MVNRVNPVVLFVRDFNRCLRFYRDILGLPVVRLDSDFAAFRMFDQELVLQGRGASAPKARMPVEALTPQAERVNPVLLCARVPNVDAAYETLRAKGVHFTKPPLDQPWGIRTAYFRDPEGNVWEFAHPLTPQPN